MVFKTDYHLMQVEKYCRMLQSEHSALLSTFIKLPVVIKTFVLSIFQWQFYTGFTVFRFLRFVVICNDCGVLMRVAKVCEW